MTPLLACRTENKLSFSHSWWYSKLSAFSIQKKTKKITLSHFPRTFHSATPTPTQPLEGCHSSLSLLPTTLHPTASTAPIQGVPEGILPPKEKSRGNVPDLSSQNSEVKAASSPLVQGPVNQSRDLDSRARDDSSNSIGLGDLLTGEKPALSVP